MNETNTRKAAVIGRVGKVAAFERLNDRASTEPVVPEPGRLSLGRMASRPRPKGLWGGGGTADENAGSGPAQSRKSTSSKTAREGNKERPE